MKKHDPINKIANKTGFFISLYIPVEKSFTHKDFVTMVHSHLRDLMHTGHSLVKREDKYLGAIIEKIKENLEIIDTRGAKSVVVFAGKDFFEVLKLPVVIPLKMHVGEKLYLEPLSKSFEENPPFIVVLIDRNRAKIIEVNFSLEEAKSKVINSDVPQRIQAKGDNMGREDKILRHIEDHLHRHLVKVVKELKSFENSFPDELIVIGAQKELVGKFKNLLSKDFQKKVIGFFGAEVDDNETELLKKAHKIVDEFLERKAWGKT